MLTVMWRRPLRAVRAFWLPLAVVVNACGLRDNSWLKCVFLGSVLGGLKRENLESIVQHFVDRMLRHQIRPGARAAIKWHREAGHRIVLATASFDFYVNALAKQLDVDDVVCTESVWCDNRLTSNLRSRNCYGEEKLRRLILLLCKKKDRPYIYTYT
ncbi:MAG: HAD-IB family phosphatase, partial [Gammaproteobacteria bacterium]